MIKLEIKEFPPSEKVTVDTIAPNTTIVEFPNFTEALQIEIELENLEDTVNFTLYYSIVDDLPDATHIIGKNTKITLPMIYH